jgi:hypothetical protein
VKREKKRKNQQDATIRSLLLTSVSTCFGHHYANPQENKDRVTALSVLLCNKWENVDISRDAFFCGIACSNIVRLLHAIPQKRRHG